MDSTYPDLVDVPESYRTVFASIVESFISRELDDAIYISLLKTKCTNQNSTVDFLVFMRDSEEDGIEVRVQDGDIWLTQKAIGQLFNLFYVGT